MSKWPGVLALALLVAGCSSADGTAGTTPEPPRCEQPGEDALAEQSRFEMTLEPNPVAPLETAELLVDGSEFGPEAAIGVDARWQCWDGSVWVTTHVVYRGFGDARGETIPVNPDFQIQVPDIALWLDRGYSIATPQVEPGIYRIADEVLVDGEQVMGFLLVEVAEG